MFQNVAEALSYLREHHIENVDLKFANLSGSWHHLSLPASQVSPALFEEGLGFDGSSTGYGVVQCGDMVAIPDIDTAFRDPFWERPTLSFICSVADAVTREPHPLDPRGVAKRAEAYLRSSGIADEVLFGPEFEYYVFPSVRHSNRNHLAFYAIESGESEAEMLEGPPFANGFAILPQGGYHAIPPLDRFRDLRCETVDELAQVGIDVRYHHHEVGAAGQQEIEVDLGPLLKMADAVMLIKYFVKNVAARHGVVATFMPKPIYNEAGSGMHFHQMLRKGEDGYPFFSELGYGGLSPLAEHYVAGILGHAAAVVGLTNPSTNSYKRLVPGFEAPVRAFYSLGNRSAAVRIPKYASSPATKRIEFRPPDATCNPYLAMAAQLMAGLDGIERKLDPRAAGFGPFDLDLCDASQRELAESIPLLPTSLEQALTCLEGDSAFLLKQGVFRPEILRNLVTLKREREALQVQRRPHPYEIALYLNC